MSGESHAADLREGTAGRKWRRWDGYLKNLSEAFEKDIRKQFYQTGSSRTFGVRLALGRLQMGQLQTTTIVTNDRTQRPRKPRAGRSSRPTQAADSAARGDYRLHTVWRKRHEP